MTESQIKAAVKEAWKNRELVKSQEDTSQVTEVTRQKYRGFDPVSGYTIVMYFNTDTCIVETAYPEREKR